MLASIFSKTRPINYIMLTLLIVTGYGLFIGLDFSIEWTTFEIIKRGGVLVLLLLMMYISQFIVSRNRLVDDSAYVPLIFTSFLFIFPTSFENVRVIVASYFILLALRRIFSLHSLKQSKEKLLDASLWICFASLFHFWSILYFILLFYAIAFFGAKDYRNWIIPLVSFLGASIFLSLYLLIQEVHFIDWWTERVQISFDFMYFDNVYQNIALAVFVSIALLYAVSQALAIKSKPYNMQNTYKKIILSFLIGAVIYVVSAEKSNGLLLFTFFPLAILGANYIESIPQRWRKEANVYSVFCIGLFFYLMQLFIL
ncbi:DUF6427 family protein [Myroides odoratus]|jgi:hypothetical protein|uniref:Beta-carotene 15,15'-monooxygenase n=1 Tax=Myroides odoratus TaxID=256 RepID=A0A9Q7E8N9_MYROD|nr:DUF6427 family protein [Myroides odoratus]EHQ42496.1 hypothetical protein Myrod_1663 [Myroides odoratus DSM 2801]EKB07876.1 hypothetical protein HMPREF9716_01518 [Myroides odoratus CIP 103059]MDR0224536.1 DUF6427 family protein [Myroides odoratus]QQT99867.1 hypothetical protein I6I88_17150 [Myroides odoratus]WQD57918.1 DUF6427 family protein [Myroides odoratus]